MNRMSSRLFAVLVTLSLLVLVRPSSALSEQPPYPLDETAAIEAPQTSPSLSFSVGRTWGTTDSPYPVNTSYLNHPAGVVANGNTIWIVESNGRQISQFSADGLFQRRIGQTGMLNYNGTTLCWPADAAIDPDGHLWVVDQCASHVVEFDINGNVLQELGQTWSPGSDNDQFQRPMGVAVDSDGNVYVSDGTPPWTLDDGNHRIQVYDANGIYLTTIGTTGVPGSGATTFHGPRYLFIDDADRLYVADSGNHRVQILDVNNPYAPVYAGTLGVTGQSGNDNTHLNSPSGVAVTSSSIYVADTYNHRVQVYDRATLIYQTTIGGYGTGNYGFENPLDVAVDDAGNVYVIDSSNLRVQSFDSGFVYRRTFGTLDIPYVTDGLHYNYPGGVAVDPNDDSFYLVETDGQRLVKLDASGGLLWTVGEPGVKGSDNDHFDYPGDVAVDQAGTVYVADTYNHRVQVFDAGGAYSATLGSYGNGVGEFNAPNGLAIGPDGLLYVADTGNHRVQVFDRSLTYLYNLYVNGYGDTHYFDRPQDVAVDTRGWVYVVDTGQNALAMFTPADPGPGYYRLDWIGRGFGLFSHLGGLATDLSDYVYLVDTGWHRLYRLHPPSYGVQEIIGAGFGDDPGSLHSPHGVAVDSRGALWVADQHNQRVQEFVRSGPGIVRTYPFSDSVDVPAHSWISVTFDDALDPSTVNGTTFRLYREGMTPVAGTVGYIPVSWLAVFRPAVDLAPNTTYTVEITTGIESIYGHALEEGRTRSFTTGDGQPPLPDDMHFFFGELHSHSGYSDGQGVPADAFATARAHGADFYALTDHAFQIDPSEWLDIGVQADLASIPGEFVALRGFEYTHDTFGHLNVFGTSDYVNRDDPDYDTEAEFYDWLAAQPDAIGQFNHPYPGMNFDDFAYHAGAAQRMALMENQGVYTESLPLGWHIAMTANSDTHEANWGDSMETGILASELTQEAILEALRARRVFNIPDQGPPMGLAMRVNGHWMGEIIPAAESLDVEVMLYTPNSEDKIVLLTIYDNGLPVDSVVPLLWEPLYTWETTIPGAPGHFYYVEAEIDTDAWVHTGSTAPVWTSDRISIYLPLVIQN
ncbi:MAG: CehA/McbA family metallohydrolase [Sedimentisphaerales bacterium]|nr:CehA/McbA family metallohydrolase [Sedimentisphaerales bacterium]